MVEIEDINFRVDPCHYFTGARRCLYCSWSSERGLITDLFWKISSFFFFTEQCSYPLFLHSSQNGILYMRHLVFDILSQLKIILAQPLLCDPNCIIC